MGLIYTRAADGSLTPVTTIHLLTHGQGLGTGIAEFSQMNDLVTAYLAAADAAYTDDNAESVSVMADYATEQGDKDRPQGLTVDSQSGTFYLQNEDSGNGWKDSAGAASYDIYNAVPNTVSQYLIKKNDGTLVSNGRIMPTGKVRMLHFLYDARNSRDLGGWACDGGTVKYGKLFRGAVVNNDDAYYQPINEAIAERIGIRRQIDLRADEEAGYKTSSSFGSAVTYDRIALNAYYDAIVNVTGPDYENAKKVFSTIFNAARHNEPLYFNCSLGRDRTGTIAFMLLALLGVARKDIDKDYELSSFSSLGAWENVAYPAYRTSTSYKALADYLSTFDGDTLRDKTVRWFLKAGFSLAELNAFRAAMTDGTPDELAAEDFVATYSIKNYLTGCETSNSETSVEAGSVYFAMFTLLDGYNTFNSINVTMGGVDVTTDVLAENAIAITSVTGDVVIRVVAVYVPTYTNQIPISTDTDGSIFNEKGYMQGYRINSSGGLTESETVWVTGFIPCESGDLVRFDGYEVDSANASHGQQRIAFYDANKTVVAAPYWSEFFSKGSTVIDETGYVSSIVVPAYDTAVSFARFANFNTHSGSIITVNEEIE